MIMLALAVIIAAPQLVLSQIDEGTWTSDYNPTETP
jgi:hypothetical protein